uniref:Autophagy-related protein 13 n=1 Tax=Xiphophorus maculatus TaxID=8083 RepID=A0A3B5QRA7_XIPMA
MDGDLSPQDKKDLDKFIKFFALKTVQVIVQARLGEKICTRSSSSPTGSDWFNLAIKDIPEVTHEAKKALAGQLPGIGRSMFDLFCLHLHCLGRLHGDIKVSYTVYNRLSVLLKSLLAITRVTPAYKLSRKQGHDYVILYRIYFGEVQLGGLGEGFQTVRVGVVGTPVGTVTLSCAYRTNLAFMSSRQFERSAPIMGIIVDHFVDAPCGNQRPITMGQPCNFRAPDEDDGRAFAGVQDSQEVCTTSFSTSPPSQVSPHSSLSLSFNLENIDKETLTALSNSGDEDGLLQSGEGRREDGRRSVSPSDPVESLSAFTRKVGAFVNKPNTQITAASLDLPFAAFAPRGLDSEENDPMVRPPDSPPSQSPLQASLHSQGSDGSGPQDDFVMVDFRPAFSKDDLLPMDLGTFYREFQNPPQLASLSLHTSSQSMADDLDSLPEKLRVYEKNIDEFDAFVDMLQ